MAVPPFLVNALMAAGSGIGSGMAPRTSSGQRSTSGSSYFSRSSLPFFQDTLGITDSASQNLQNQLREITGQRRANLSRALDRQLSAIQGVGDQELRNINQRYDSRRGAARQAATNRGLYNSTVRPGMEALNERERNRALGTARDRQKQILGNVLGQRAQSLDRADVDAMNLLTQLGFQDYGLRTLLPKAVASSRVSSQQSQNNERSGLLSRLFG